jgi:hypothetical protein
MKRMAPLLLLLRGRRGRNQGVGEGGDPMLIPKWSMTPLDDAYPEDRRWRIWLIIFLLMLSFLPFGYWGCSFVQGIRFRQQDGQEPTKHKPEDVVEGWTKDEVIANIGTPHRRVTREDGGEAWTFYTDNLESGYFRVNIDPQGRVTNVKKPGRYDD